MKKTPVVSPMDAVVVSYQVAVGDAVQEGGMICVLEAMKVQTQINAPAAGEVMSLACEAGALVKAGEPLAFINEDATSKMVKVQQAAGADSNAALEHARNALGKALDENRPEAVKKRHEKGYRTARENLADLCDENSFNEYGQLAVAAQRQRRDIDDLRDNTSTDGIITGTATINRELFGEANSQAAVIINDYSVLAATQGFFHHAKLDRMIEKADELNVPVVMYTEGGGGRPGDTDVTTQIAGLNLHSFLAWAKLAGKVPRIAVNNGYCFAGSAALFGCSDIRIATKASWIGMAGPAMIEGGGLGKFKPTEIGPTEVQAKNGVVDLVADDEAHATQLARQVLGMFQGSVTEWQAADQTQLRDFMPADRRFTYDIRKLIHVLVDVDSFIELQPDFGPALITGFARLEGRPVAILANNSKHLGGAIDAEASDKASRFFDLCGNFGLPLLSLCDTPGFMVGPDSEEQAAVHRMSQMFITGARMDVPLVTVFLRKGYGLGAMAMAGGSFARPIYAVSWPTGEFGAMGLEGAVSLGFRKELEAQPDKAARKALFDKLLHSFYEKGRATEAASFLEIDGVIDPAETRAVVLRAFAAAGRS